MNVIVTGSTGLIGAEAVKYYDKLSKNVIGIDNNMRKKFFGPDGDTTWMRKKLEETCPHYKHYSIDIRDQMDE